MKIVYVVGGLLAPNGMSSVLSAKINYLAEHTDYDIYMILTEKAGKEWYYRINPKVKWVNFDINFDELDIMPLYKKLFCYTVKQRRYKRLFTDYLMDIRPDITVSTVRREINFINDIQDGSKKIGEIHFNRNNYRNFNKKWLPSFVNRYISKKWMNSLLKQLQRLERFVVLSNEDYNHWPELNNKLVIPNSLNYFPTFYSSCDSNRIIAAGRYTYQKGFDLLIDAWEIVKKSHPHWLLDIYGAGDTVFYESLAKRKNVSDVVRCHGAVSDIYAKYRESSIFVLSSRYEGFGMVLLEAMSTGLPAVSFACPCGPSDIIHDGEDGILVENGHVKKLADAIIWMIENPQKRIEFGVKARENSKRFSQDTIMKNWIDLFDSVMKK